MNLRRIGVRALATTTVTYAASDILSEEEEKLRNRSTRPSVDPVTGLQAIMAVNSVASAIEQQNVHLESTAGNNDSTVTLK